MTAGMNSLLQPAVQNALAASTALITALGGTNIFYGFAPKEQSLPYIIYSLYGGPDNTSSWERWTKELEIRVYADNAGSVDTIDSLCSQAITEADLTVTGFCPFLVERTDDAPVIPLLQPDNRELPNGGAFYTIRLTRHET